MNFYITPVKGQDYSFEVRSEKVNVYIEKDGSITIEYWIEFYCDPLADPIDVVDIGFPNEHYDFDSVEADLDGHELTMIYTSEVIQIGVEIWLGSYEILPGESGTLHVKGNNPKMIYQDWEDTSMASVEFSPTWFNSDFCNNYDYLEVNFYFPDGLSNGNEVKYHDEKYTDYSYDDDGDLIYTWILEDVPMRQYKFGVSFPLKYVDSYLPWTMNPQIVMIIVSILLLTSIIALIAGSIYLFYRYKKVYRIKYYPPIPRRDPADVGVGICCFAFIGGFILLMFWAFLGDIILIFTFFGIFIAGFGMIGYLIYLKLSTGKLPYTKPDIKIDSIGANTHLSVVEAAIIQNVHLNKVVFLIIFSLIRTGHLKIIESEPIKFEVVSPKKPTNLKTYQQKFLNTILKTGKGKGKVNKIKLKKLLIDLIKHTYTKMKSHNLNKTILYYNNMTKEAWASVKSMPSEIEWEDIEKAYEWLILDDDFEPKSKKYLENRYYYHRPYYYRHYYYYDHYYYRGHYRRYYTGASTTKPPMQHINIHSFSDSVVRSIESISNNIVSGFSKFAETITNAVAPVRPRSTGGGYRGGGGGGCACACACAGCACACAGGGR